MTWLNNGGKAVSSNQSLWPLMGLAMRVVQALGLHRDPKLLDLPLAEVEERRRVFWEVGRSSRKRSLQIHSYDINISIACARPHGACASELELIEGMPANQYDVEFPAIATSDDWCK